MKNKTQNKAVVSKRAAIKAVILWAAIAVLIVLCLVPVINLIWSQRLEDHIRNECEMIADAQLEQSISDEDSVEEWRKTLRLFVCAQNVMAAWADIYGGLDEEEYDRFAQLTTGYPEGLAYLKGDDYHVLAGDFPREEFDAALEARQSLTGNVQYTLDALKDGEHHDNEQGFLNESSAVTIDGDVWYYSTSLEVAGAVVISKDTQNHMTAQDQELYLLSMIDQRMTESEKDMLLVRLSDQTVIWVRGDLPVKEQEQLAENAFSDGELRLGDTTYIAGYSDKSGYRFYALAPVSENKSSGLMSPVLPALLFALLFLLTLVYAWLLRIDILRGRVEFDHKSAGRRGLFGILVRHVRLIFLLVLLCTLGLFLLFSTLYVIDDIRVWGSRILTEIETYLDGDDQNVDLVYDSRQMSDNVLADAACYLLESSPERREETALVDLCMAIEKSLFLLKKDGTVEAASNAQYDFSMIQDKDSEWAPLKSVMEGKADHITVMVQPDGNTCLCQGVRRKKLPGMLIYLDDIADPVPKEEVYSDYWVPDGLLLFCINSETGEILSCSDEKYKGRDASSIGLKGDACENGFIGDITLDGSRYFVQTRTDGDRVSLIAADEIYFVGLYLPLVLGTMAAGLLMVLLMFGLIYVLQKKLWLDLREGHAPGREDHSEGGKASADSQFSARQKMNESTLQGGPEKEKKEKGECKEQEEAEREENASFYWERGGALHADQTAAGRWLEMAAPFRMMSADERFHLIVILLMAVMFVTGFLYYHTHGNVGVLSSTFAFLLQRTWDRGINIYSICYVLLIILVIYVAAGLLRRVIMLFCRNFGNKGETIARLLGSFIGYAALIGVIVHSLTYLGVNAMTILASAGIVGLGISIGARDLVSDILAGISIVFEGEFRTGDIVDIGGFRGEVQEIGIRTTKIMSMGNVKVFRNSEVSGVINMTQRHSIAQAKVYVSRAEPLEKVEKIFKNALPSIRRRIPQALDQIVLCGIEQTDPAFIVLLFQTKCKEADRVVVERGLSREFVILMEKENLGSRGFWKES